MSVYNIKTIIIVMMENRSFDHVLGYLSLDGKDVNGLSADPPGNRISRTSTAEKRMPYMRFRRRPNLSPTRRMTARRFRRK